MRRLTVGLLAHVDAGKTTLAEALLYTAGSIRKLGRVDHRDTALDTHSIERERGITVFSKQARLETKGLRLCLLDTPGHAELAAEAERTLGVIDYALLIISAPAGVQAHTETLWSALEQANVPVIIFVTKTDLAADGGQAALVSLRERLSEACFDAADRSKAALENLAVCSEELLEAYTAHGEIPDGLMAKAIKERKLFPVLFGSGLKLTGVSELLDFLDKYTLSPEYPADFGARVYKIMRDERGRRLSCMKITGGQLNYRDSVNGETATELRLYSGAGYSSVRSAEAGDIVAAAGPDKTYAGQGLGFERDFAAAGDEAPLSCAVVLDSGCDPQIAYRQIKQLEEEDPRLEISWDARKRQIRLRLMGKVQAEVVERLIKDRFGLNARLERGGVAYKETVSEPVFGAGHFEPLRHYAEVHLLLEPAPQGSGLSFESRCPTDELDRNWQSLILSCLEEKTHLGVLTGSPLTDVKISLIAGRAHPKHTEGGDFREASSRALRQALMKAKSVLLEPWYEFRIETAPELVGRVISDVRAMGGSFETDGAALVGKAPVSEMGGYAEELAAFTSGRGRISLRPAGYLPCHNAEQVLDGSAYDPRADLENTPDSVFCSHGAGTTVPWNEAERFMHLHTETAEKPAPPPRPRFFSLDDAELEAIMEREFGPVRRRQYTRPAAAEPAQTEVPPSKREYVIVDGYNFIFGTGEYSELARLSLSLARERLSDALRSYAAMRGCELLLVFDGYRVAGSAGAREEGLIRTVYTKENETADMYIERLADEIGKNYLVRVVTNDSLIRLSALRSGVLRQTVRDFETELKQTMELIEQYVDGK